MSASYVLSQQVYLALPLQAARVLGAEAALGSALVFVLSGAIAVFAQVRVAAWARARYAAAWAVGLGVGLMATAFLPLLAFAWIPPDRAGGGPMRTVAALLPLAAAAVLLALGTVLAYPFEMDTIVSLAGDRLVATHYGLYNTVAGIGITLGNLGTGLVWDAGASRGWPWLVWSVLAAVGAFGVLALFALVRAGHLPDAAPRRHGDRMAPQPSGDTPSPRSTTPATTPPTTPATRPAR
ncbi:MAG: hypothetical protein ACT4QG_07980 [Sporichthyaceae bacterium]